MSEQIVACLADLCSSSRTVILIIALVSFLIGVVIVISKWSKYNKNKQAINKLDAAVMGIGAFLLLMTLVSIVIYFLAPYAIGNLLGTAGPVNCSATCPQHATYCNNLTGQCVMNL